MEKLWSIKESTLNTLFLEKICQKIESTVKYVSDEKLMPIVLGISSIFVASTVYIYYHHKYTYWKRKGIPSPPVTPFLGHTLALAGPPVLTQETWLKKYGSVIGIYLGTKPALVVSDSEMLNEVLVRHFRTFAYRRVSSGLEIHTQSINSKNGLEWKHDRAIMSPAFTSGKVKQLLPLINEVYEHLDRQMDLIADRGDQVSLKPLFSKFTLMIIAKSAFGTHIDPFNHPDDKFIRMLAQWIDFTPVKAFMRFFMPDWAKKLFKYSAHDREASEYLAHTLKQVIEKRRSNANAHNEHKDLLQFMIDAKLDESEITTDGPKTTKFSEAKIIANSILFFMAGYETSSTLLTWATYSFAMNADIQEQLYQEVKDLKDEKGELDYETVNQLQYLDAVLKECLRMYPPVTRIERKSLDEHTFQNGLTVEKDTWIVIPIHAVGHNCENWSDPETFRPERFLPENRHNIKACSLLAFSDGPRYCIGNRFGMFEVKKAICELLLKYKFIRTARTPEKPVFDKYTIILEVDELPLKVVRRNLFGNS